MSFFSFRMLAQPVTPLTRSTDRQRDSVIRLFYVGMTRARHTLYICQRESPMAVTI